MSILRYKNQQNLYRRIDICHFPDVKMHKILIGKIAFVISPMAFLINLHKIAT